MYRCLADEDAAHARGVPMAAWPIFPPRASPTNRSAKCKCGPRWPTRTSISPRGPRALCGPAKRSCGASSTPTGSPGRSEHYKTSGRGNLPRDKWLTSRRPALELDDFIESIRMVRQPRVNGQAGRDALAVAEQILASIAANRGEEETAAVYPRILPTPHFDLSAIGRKAG